ncbi:MAG: DUF883 family protein, partial [Xanthomonadaceae bacterium]|nr:DUF883 family protein [Xanthomonadaceae bacterium]
MDTVNARLLQSDLRALGGDVERLLQDLAASADDEVGQVQSRLRAVGARIAQLERDADQTLHRAAAGGNRFVHRQPWLVLGGVAAAALLLGLVGGR